MRFFYTLLIIVSLQNPVCILYGQHILAWTRHIHPKCPRATAWGSRLPYWMAGPRTTTITAAAALKD